MTTLQEMCEYMVSQGAEEWMIRDMEECLRVDQIEGLQDRPKESNRPTWVLFKRCQQIASDFKIEILPIEPIKESQYRCASGSTMVIWRCTINSKQYGGAVIYQPGSKSFEELTNLLMVQAHQAIARAAGLTIAPNLDQPLNDTTTGAAPPGE